MTLNDVDSIHAAALRLSDDERLMIVDRLLESFPESLQQLQGDTEFLEEIDRRSTDSAPSIPWDQVRDS